MNELQPLTSTGIGSPTVSQNFSLGPIPSLPTTIGTSTIGNGVIQFDLVKKWISNKPLRIRIADDPTMNEVVVQLAKQWMDERPRGSEIHEMVKTPSYQAIIVLGYRAVRPLLLMLQQNPDHWFYALHEITGENPVPIESEGRLIEMASAWIKWGKEHGYLGSMD
jgi:hypothetical protein